MKYFSIVVSIILQVTFFTNGELLNIESKKLAGSENPENLAVNHKNIQKKFEPLEMFVREDEDEFISKEVARRSNQTNQKMITNENKGIHEPVTPKIIKNKYYADGLGKIHSNKLTKLEENSKKLKKMEAEIEELQKEIELMDEL